MSDFVLRISIPDDTPSRTREQWIADTIHRAACRMISHPLDRAVISPDSDAIVGGWQITGPSLVADSLLSSSRDTR